MCDNGPLSRQFCSMSSGEPMSLQADGIERSLHRGISFKNHRVKGREFSTSRFPEHPPSGPGGAQSRTTLCRRRFMRDPSKWFPIPDFRFLLGQRV